MTYRHTYVFTILGQAIVILVLLRRKNKSWPDTDIVLCAREGGNLQYGGTGSTNRPTFKWVLRVPHLILDLLTMAFCIECSTTGTCNSYYYSVFRLDMEMIQNWLWVHSGELSVVRVRHWDELSVFWVLGFSYLMILRREWTRTTPITTTTMPTRRQWIQLIMKTETIGRTSQFIWLSTRTLTGFGVRSHIYDH